MKKAVKKEIQNFKLAGEPPCRLEALNRRGVYHYDVGSGSSTDVMVILIIW